MPASYDFSDGSIAQNIVNALMDCEAKDISALERKGYLKFLKNDYTLKYKSLFYRGLDSYSEVSGYSMRYFLFGSDEVPASRYTKIDAQVIRALNTLAPEQLQILRHAIDMFYSSPIMHLGNELSPNKRFNAVLRTKRKSGLTSTLTEEEKAKYRLDISVEVRRYQKVNYASHFQFNSDYWPDLATMVGVSVRWLLGIKRSPLFCDSAAADDIFDLYTLMAPIQKIGFVGLLSRFSNEFIPELEQVFFEGKGL